MFDIEIEKRAALATTQREEMRIRLEPFKQDLDPLTLTGFESDLVKKWVEFVNYWRAARMPSLAPFLPLLFNLKGRPYTLRNHYLFEPFFHTRRPLADLLKTGRQVSKSTSLAALLVILAMTSPYTTILVLTPLYEMVRRFSHNYVRPFIETSSFAHLFTSPKKINSVLQRSFINESNVIFSFAYLNADRTRGVPADFNVIDEVQNMYKALLGVVHETLSGSPRGLRIYAGTPMSLDNTMEWLWQQSSKGEWFIKCRNGGCNYWNIPKIDEDLIKMIGPPRDDICEQRPGLVCARCQKPLAPRTGMWLHEHEDRRWDFRGLHVPQPIVPDHFADATKWRILWGKVNGLAGMTEAEVHNEVFGESSDEGVKLVSKSELIAASCLPWKNDAKEAKEKMNQYLMRVVVADWGGGGGRLRTSANDGRRERQSFTVFGVLGLRPDGRIDVVWGHRSLKTFQYLYEARVATSAFKQFNCAYIVHDFGGMGAARETFLRQAGFPAKRIVGMAYFSAPSKKLIIPHPETEDSPAWVGINKVRSLVFTCQAIKYGFLNFFQYDEMTEEADNKTLISDFMSLIEEKTPTRQGSDISIIDSKPGQSDDFAQAVNIGAHFLWYRNNGWPNITIPSRFEIDAETWEIMHPSEDRLWSDI